MKVIAHRGWAQGSGENTLAAFERAAADPRVSGVEFDVRRDARSGMLVVTHDPPGSGPVLPLDDALAVLIGTQLDLFVEIKEAGIDAELVERLVAAGLAERSLVFAFAEVAQSFRWQAARPVRLGAILLYPWTMHRFMEAHRPDMILLGWDTRLWTRLAFRAWWSVFPLAGLARRYGKPVIVGIVRRKADLDWLARQNIYAAVADMDCIVDSPPPS